MPVVGIIQARIGSTRLPGKAMADIRGRPMLARMVDRVRHCRELDRLVIATTTKKADQPIVDLAEELGAAYFRGSEEDVLDRYYRAALAFGADPVVRLTSDCPLIDPRVCDTIIRAYLSAKPPYDEFAIGGPFPEGLDVQIIRFEALKKAWAEARLPSEREHVGPYILNHPELFRTGQWVWPDDHDDFRLTVDEPADLELVRAVYAALDDGGRLFPIEEILTFLKERPDLTALNSGIARNEGYQASLVKDREFLANNKD